MVQYCFQEKGTGAILFSGEGNRCSTLLTFLKEKETDAILLLEERN